MKPEKLQAQCLQHLSNIPRTQHGLLLLTYLAPDSEEPKGGELNQCWESAASAVEVELWNLFQMFFGNCFILKVMYLSEGKQLFF